MGRLYNIITNDGRLLFYSQFNLLGSNGAVEAWINASNSAKVVHANMVVPKLPLSGTMADLLSPACQRALLSSADFSEEFFSVLSPVDQPVEVLRILQSLYAYNPADFKEYESLALAIAVVYDVPPPPDFPHSQVSAWLLPRRFPAALTAFWYWVRLDRDHYTPQALRFLPAGELKYLVDTVTPLEELTWIRTVLSPNTGNLAQLYQQVKYREERIATNRYDWTGADYKLATILQDGGICVDQAYFASNAGKAVGIPTLLFVTSGGNARHAWFGLLGPNGWQMDAGRQESQRLIVGRAYDPQTWHALNDFEVRFLSERFRRLPQYKLSEIHALYAAEFQRIGNLPEALRAAREAVNRDRRNLSAWHLLLAIMRSDSRPPEQIEAVLQEAAVALGAYPDLEIVMRRQLIESWRVRGLTSVAAQAEREMLHKFETNRSDLVMDSAAESMRRTMQEDPLPTQIQVYNRLLANYGTGAGIDFYDNVVRNFALYLQQQGQIPAAIQCLDRARRTLAVEKGSPLDTEMSELRDRLENSR